MYPPPSGRGLGDDGQKGRKKIRPCRAWPLADFHFGYFSLTSSAAAANGIPLRVPPQSDHDLLAREPKG